MYYSYDDGGRVRTIVVVLVAALVGAVVVALVWAGWALLGDDDGGRAREAPPSSIPSELLAVESEEPEAPDAVTSRLNRCGEVHDAQTSLLAAVDPALDQWEVHIGAMNQLVTGALTLQQATEFWDQTRVGAARNLDGYRLARTEFAGRTVRCPPPTASESSPDLRACAAAVAARNRALRLADVTLATWRVHVHHMEMLRQGEMTPEEATRLWLQSWRQGDREVRAYRSAAEAADQRAC